MGGIDRLSRVEGLDRSAELTDELAGLDAVLREEWLGAGEKIPATDEDRIGFLKSGRVRVMSGEVVVAVADAGDLLVIRGLRAGASPRRAVAIEDSVLISGSLASLLSVVSARPAIATRVVTALVQQLLARENHVEEVATQSVDGRLARLLLLMARDEGGRVVVRDISQVELARMIGASRESVSRALGIWERASIVRRGQRLIEIIDGERLERA